MIRIDLPYPAAPLWPNARPHWSVKSKAAKAHREWARLATMEALQEGAIADLRQRPIPIRITVYPKSRGPYPDRDNCGAAAKSLLDGIADKLGVNDKAFASPVVSFADAREGRFVVEVG